MKESDLSRIIYRAISIAKNYDVISVAEKRKFKTNSDKLKFKNKLRSSVFVKTIADSLYEDCNRSNQLNVISIDTEGKRISGEFMLDITVEESDSYKNFVWAVESESKYDEKEFFRDFRKLMYVRSKNYLYLNGLVSKDQKTKDEDIQDRLEKALNILRKSSISDQEHNFYFSFFPYPGKPQKSEVDETILNELYLSLVDTVKPNNDGIYNITFDDIICGKYVHLDTIETYKYMRDKFELISMYPFDECVSTFY